MSISRNDIEQLSQYDLSFDESWMVVDHFERLIAEFYGAPYAVATDCCTHALELAVRMCNPTGSVTVPRHTYMSVPMMLEKLGVQYRLDTVHWNQYYQLNPLPVVDAAVCWQAGSYVKGTLMCLSFQFKKHLPIGRGGMILLDDHDQYLRLQRLVRDGRDRSSTQFNSDVTEVGYHYYMTPEDAARGIHLFYQLKDVAPKPASMLAPQGYKDYKDLLEYTVFKHKSRLRPSMLTTLESKYEILDSFDFVENDVDPATFLNFIQRWSQHSFLPNERLLIVNLDCDFYPEEQSIPVGNNSYNFFRLCSHFGLPTEFVLYVTTTFGTTKEVHYLCRKFNGAPPTVIETICVPVTTTQEVKSVDFNEHLISRTFVLMNRMLRMHRLLLLCYLKEQQLFDHGHISYLFDQQHPTSTVKNSSLSIPVVLRTTTPPARINDSISLSAADYQVLDRYTKDFVNQHCELSIEKNINLFDYQPDALQFGLVNIITETVFEYPYPWISEKTIKSILMKRPFIIVGPAGTLNKLNDLGFRTFNSVWNESYDSIGNSSDRIKAIVDLIKELSFKDINQLIDAVKDIAEFNYTHYANNFAAKDMYDIYE
jgi:hypothetical protein